MKCWSHGTSQLLLIHNLKNEKIISRNSSLIRFVRYLKKQYTFVHKQATARCKDSRESTHSVLRVIIGIDRLIRSKWFSNKTN